MLLGRERERDQIAALLERARNGRGGALLLRGEPGIGKTALLADALDTADGFRTLRAQGLESEIELSFSALADVLMPLESWLERIPLSRAEALRGALALGPSLSADRFAVAAATLSLLSAAAEDAPVLVALDDAHWLDTNSAEALLFAARRIRAEALVVLVTIRDAEPSTVDRAGLPELRLGGLDAAPAAELASRVAGGPLPPEVITALVSGTAGNPLALVEAVALLTPGQLAGREPLPEYLPAGDRIEAGFARRTAGLPRASRHALLLASADESGSADLVLRALRFLEIDAGAFEPAERAGLVTIDGGRLEFRHPLVRAAVYRSAAPPDRRAVHAALAQALDRLPARASRAWHLAAAAAAPDESVAAELEAAGREAIQRSGHAAGAAALERAARLTTDDGQRARRLRESAEAWHRAGRPERAVALLEQALPIATDARLRGAIQHLRGRIAMHVDPARAGELLREAATAIRPEDPAWAAQILSESVLVTLGPTNRGSLSSDRAIADAVASAREAARLVAGASPDARLLPDLVLEWALRRAGKRDAYGNIDWELLREHVDSNPDLAVVVLFALTEPQLKPDQRTREFIDHVIASARARGALAVLPAALHARGRLLHNNGLDATPDLDESLRLAEDLGQAGWVAENLQFLAFRAGMLGRLGECEAYLERARELPVRPAFDVQVRQTALTAAGRYAEVIELLEPLELEKTETLPDFQMAGDLVEALAHGGHRQRAEELLAVLERRAPRAGHPWVASQLACARGLLAEDGAFESHFVEAIRVLDADSLDLLVGHAKLYLGERRRRAGRRVAARAPLREALQIYERLGATAWAARARAELAAAGDPVQSNGSPRWHELTPQEQTVALTVAQGATNTEAAASLFLSRKTIEFHLRNVYRKLDIRSRAELARLVATRELAQRGG